MTSATTLDAALNLAAHLLPVFPLHFPVRRRDGLACSCRKPCGNNAAKHPFTAHGCKDATTDPKLIADWWRQQPRANIGLATGAAIVLDVDPRHGGFESLVAFETEHDVLPDTWTARTGSGGRHYYFAAPGSIAIRNSSGKLAAGLDIKAKGGYAVAPPSLHISGNAYSWIHAPDEAPLAPMPEWLVTALTPPPAPRLPQSRTTLGRDRGAVSANVRISGLLVTVARAAEGSRNALTFWAASRVRDMVRDGAIDHATGMDVLVELRQAAAHAGLTPREINLTITSALRASS